MAEFIIVFREVLEAGLIVGIICTVLIKNQLKSHLKNVYWGIFSAIFASVGVAFFVLKLKNIIGTNALKNLLEGIFIYIAAGFIYYVIFWLAKQISQTKAIEEETLSCAKLSKWGIFFLIFFSIIREGFETVIFLVSSFSMQGSFSYIGFGLGATAAIALSYFVVIQGKKIKLKRFFSISSLCLVFLASGMIAYATHEIEEYLIKSQILSKQNIARTWDILKPKNELNQSDLPFLYTYNEQKQNYYHLFYDKGKIGVFLKGFLGYNSNPNRIEFFLWFISLIFGLSIWQRFYLKKPAPA